MRQSRKFSGEWPCCVLQLQLPDIRAFSQKRNAQLRKSAIGRTRPVASIREHAFLRRHIGAEARRGRPSVARAKKTCIAHR